MGKNTTVPAGPLETDLGGERCHLRYAEQLRGWAGHRLGQSDGAGHYVFDASQQGLHLCGIEGTGGDEVPIDGDAHNNAK